ncbi:Neurochondrin-domain-containing protein [Tricladium varicosporioides]|nr:Neurochondrin-domain-containing protein [Hymenoscyphus varicosporioides]
MDKTNILPRTAPTEPPNLTDAAATFEKMQELLKTKNDTSRFVGLALLKSVLDNGHLAQDPTRLRILWEALSPKFLDRLLYAQENEKITKSESRDMVNLSVAILHTFTNLLPRDALKEKRLIGRVGPLVKALVNSPTDTTQYILQTLLSIVSQIEGARELLHIPDISALTELATQHSLVLDVLLYMWINASTVSDEISSVHESIDKIIPTLIVSFRQTDAVTFIQCVASLIPKLTPEALPLSPRWLTPLVSILRGLVSRKPTVAGRAAYTNLAAALLQAYPRETPILLFKDDASGSVDSKPFSYLFINLLLIDLRSTFPSLLPQLNSTGYPDTSRRLAAAFDVLSSFIGFLVRSLDDDISIPSFSMPPDLLLKLRKDIAESISLCIEYLRDRWDASVAGVSGLHPSARTGTSATSEGTRLTLTWESIKDNATADPLTLAAIRALAIWIREDENDNLRNECCGLMDMFVELYKCSSEGLDFRYPILLAFEVIMLSENGVEAFLGQCGWEVISKDLVSILKSIDENHVSGTASMIPRGLEIVRVLLAVVDHPSIFSPREEWMEIITHVSSMKTSATLAASVLELQIGTLQLTAALLSKAAGGVQKRYVTSFPPLLGIVNQLRGFVGQLDETESTDLMALLDDVSLELDNLRNIR